MSITVTGRAHRHATGRSVAVGAVSAVGRAFGDADIAYDGWTPVGDLDASDWTVHLASRAGASISAPVSGTGVTLLMQTSPTSGRARITIDGVRRGVIDLYSPTTDEQSPFSFSGLTQGVHTVTVTALGRKQAASTGTDVAVDAFVSIP
jgi:hypothetical protein